MVTGPARHFDGAAVLATVPWARNERSAVAGAKTTSYAENVVALAYAHERGADEALFLDTRGNVCEGTGTNVFWVRDGRIVTPALSTGCLAGVTRALVVEWCGAEEVETDLDELASAAEVFLTSSTRDVQAVRAVDGVTLPAPGPVTAEAAAVFAERSAEGPRPLTRGRGGRVPSRWRVSRGAGAPPARRGRGSRPRCRRGPPRTSGPGTRRRRRACRTAAPDRPASVSETQTTSAPRLVDGQMPTSPSPAGACRPAASSSRDTTHSTVGPPSVRIDTATAKGSRRVVRQAGRHRDGAPGGDQVELDGARHERGRAGHGGTLGLVGGG